MSNVRRLLFALVVVVSPLAVSGCFYHDIDIETVDHYSHYGHSHTVDLERYHSDGCDD